MDVSEKNARIWRREINGRNGVFYKYTTGVSKKKEDGTYDKAYIDIKFSKKSGAPDVIENGAKCDYKGFVVPDIYTDKDGKEVSRPLIIVMEAMFDNNPDDIPDSFSQAEDDIPFN